jgi:hypothetical protein
MELCEKMTLLQSTGKGQLQQAVDIHGRNVDIAGLSVLLEDVEGENAEIVQMMSEPSELVPRSFRTWGPFIWKAAKYLCKALQTNPTEAPKMNGLRYTEEEIGALLLSVGEWGYEKLCQLMPVPARSTSEFFRAELQRVFGFDTEVFDGSAQHIEAIINRG